MENNFLLSLDSPLPLIDIARVFSRRNSLLKGNLLMAKFCPLITTSKRQTSIKLILNSSPEGQSFSSPEPLCTNFGWNYTRYS